MGNGPYGAHSSFISSTTLRCAPLARLPFLSSGFATPSAGFPAVSEFVSLQGLYPVQVRRPSLSQFFRLLLAFLSFIVTKALLSATIVTLYTSRDAGNP